MAKHPKVFDGVCRVMDCEPVYLTLREGAIPVQIRGYRNIAEPLIHMFKDELMRPRPPSATRSRYTVHQRRRHYAQRFSIRRRPHHGRLP
jgi:hypothetical protein